jgi:predicted ATPase
MKVKILNEELSSERLESEPNQLFDERKILVIRNSSDNKILCRVSKRKIPKVIRFRRYQMEKEPNNYFREKLMLYIPWRSEEGELINIDVRQKFIENIQLIERKEHQYNHNINVDFDKIRQEIESNFNNEIDNQLDENEDDMSDKSTDKDFEVYDLQRPYYELENDVQIKKTIETKDKVLTFNCPKTVTDEEYKRIHISLNRKQRQYLLGLMNLVKQNKVPFLHFITGGAGTGKSVLIRSSYQSLRKYYESDFGGSISPDKLTVLLLAPTGKAAFNIGGTTIHSALGITTNENISSKASLSDEMANKYLNQLWHLKVIIIDEISMMGSNMLEKVDNNLRRIFKTNSKPFGGISIIFVGDFNQLKPVKDHLIFDYTASKTYSALAGNINLKSLNTALTLCLTLMNK